MWRVFAAGGAPSSSAGTHRYPVQPASTVYLCGAIVLQADSEEATLHDAQNFRGALKNWRRQQTHFWLCRVKETCLVALNVVLCLLSDIKKLKQMWLFLNVLYVTVYVVAYQILRYYFFCIFALSLYIVLIDLLIYSAPQLQECLINLYLFTYFCFRGGVLTPKTPRLENIYTIRGIITTGSIIS